MGLLVMDVRKVLLGWLIYVAATTAVYALLLNGKFGRGGELPAWVIAATSVMAVVAIVALIYWVRGVATGRVPSAGALWLMIPIATITYSLCVVWMYHRYTVKQKNRF